MRLSISNIRMPHEMSEQQLLEMVRALKGFEAIKIDAVSIVRRARDFRKKNQPVYCYTVHVEVASLNAVDLGRLQTKNKTLHINIVKEAEPAFAAAPIASAGKKVLVVGAGPAGYFAALRLAERGFNVTLLERGKAVEDRDKDVAELSMKGILNPESNICFGEGGAGTYSDGKLVTRKHDPHIRRILETFVRMGAPPEILTSNRPHIGTDILRRVVQALRKSVVERGVEVSFGEKFQDVVPHEARIVSVQTSRRTVEDLSDLVLAVGHSARDTYRMLFAKGIQIEAKPFAVGVRCEHPQEFINRSQHGARAHGPAEYRLVHNLDKRRSAYSFCMCPGGVVVCSSAQAGHLAVNGMSNSKRSGPYANAALVVKVDLADFPSPHPLAGIEFQERIEMEALRAAGSGYCAPAQRITDFLGQKQSSDLPKSSYRPGIVSADLNSILPEFVAECLRASLPIFDRKIHGFVSSEALLIGVETKTSSPVRILRDDSGCAAGIRNLYPIGEGAGYAGGIMSSALDGMLAAEKIAAKYV